jgi:hypothetical protein
VRWGRELRICSRATKAADLASACQSAIRSCNEIERKKPAFRCRHRDLGLANLRPELFHRPSCKTRLRSTRAISTACVRRSGCTTRKTVPSPARIPSQLTV